METKTVSSKDYDIIDMGSHIELVPVENHPDMETLRRQSVVRLGIGRTAELARNIEYNS